jgi:ethanolamine ammonia-lyase small subunit
VSKSTHKSLWSQLRSSTQARIGLDRIGHALGTGDLLEFQLAHAQARDAVLQKWDVPTTESNLRSRGLATLTLASQTSNRSEYLQRPDLGRSLSRESAAALKSNLRNQEFELVLIVTDGLSAKAIKSHLEKFLDVLIPRLTRSNFSLALVLLIPFARVGISDAIGDVLKSKLVVILVGERPGLSSTDSLGIYLTYQAASGRTDADRNCISNVRPPMGLGYDQAADKLLYLMSESLRLKLSGVNLKEDANPELSDVRMTTVIDGTS